MSQIITPGSVYTVIIKLLSYDVYNNALKYNALGMIKYCKVICYINTLVRQWCPYIYFEKYLNTQNCIYQI